MSTPFIYNPSEAKRLQRTRDDASQAAAQWICGEVATVEVEIWNPTSQEFEVVFPSGTLCDYVTYNTFGSSATALADMLMEAS